MRKILLVDDMRLSLELDASFLARADCALRTAVTGSQAVEAARAERPDLIILDAEMPVMDGLVACRILKGDPDTREIPVVIVSLEGKAEAALGAGADLFLAMPFDEPRFLDTVKRFVPIVERSEPRVPVDAPISWRRDDLSSGGRLMNVSRNGFLFSAASLPEAGARIEVTFVLPRDVIGLTVSGDALVVRHEEATPPLAGSRRLRMPQEPRALVDDYFGRRAQAAS